MEYEKVPHMPFLRGPLNLAVMVVQWVCTVQIIGSIFSARISRLSGTLIAWSMKISVNVFGTFNLQDLPLTVFVNSQHEWEHFLFGSVLKTAVNSTSFWIWIILVRPNEKLRCTIYDCLTSWMKMLKCTCKLVRFLRNWKIIPHFFSIIVILMEIILIFC